MAYTDYKSQGLPNSNTYSDGATHWRIRAGHSDFHFQHTDEGVHGCGKYRDRYWADKRFLDIIMVQKNMTESATPTNWF